MTGEKVKALVEAALALPEPSCHEGDADGGTVCLYCEADLGYEKHWPSCPWIKLREAARGAKEEAEA